MMLVLSRRKDEKIKIIDRKTGEVIVEILVVDIICANGRLCKTRLGFAASQDYGIHRDEVYEAIKNEGKPA
jgi:carbon storage regulator CsrA